MAATAESPTLTITVNDPGSVPYLYFDEQSQDYVGIVPDFLRAFATAANYQIEYIEGNQFRSEQNILDGKADLLLINPAWLDNPRLVLVSEPLLSHDTYLYATEPFSPDFTLESAYHARVCAHHLYVYTGLEALFKSGQLIRVNAPNHLSMASMLIRKRCDFAVMNNFNAVDIFYKPQFCKQAVYQSPEPTSVVDLNLVMPAGRTALKSSIDNYMHQYQTSGALQESIIRHCPTPGFPKKPNCS